MKLFKVVAALGLALVIAKSAPAAPKNPKTENPLPTCPPDWKVEVIAEVPRILHPSAVCVTPDGRVLVGQDPMDQSPEGIKPIDSILCYHPDGRVTVWATNLYAVFGLAYYDGKVYVHQYPRLSLFTDSGDTGTNPQELFTTHPKPIGGLNDHIPANLRLAMDGYFYMDTGDKGIYGAVGKDGSRVDLIGGGIMRFRPDATELEIYANGTRNHLDIAINWEDEMFTYDNTDDGNGWWTRVTHMVDRGWYGYPYDYKPRQPYTLWMMQDYGGGSPTGAICYNEDALPEEYQGNLFMSEWGKGELDRFVVERDGASYKIAKREAFLKKQGKEFRPLGIDITPDGMGFYVADWNYGGWMARGELAGRFLKVTYTGASRGAPKPSWYVPAAMGKPVAASLEQLLAGLKHPSQRVRLVAQRRVAEKGTMAVPNLTKMLKDSALPIFARASALWTLDAIDGGKSARAAILAVAGDKDITLRAQAIRELGTRKVQQAVPALVKALKDENPVIRFRSATALGRVADVKAITPLLQALGEKDFFTRYSIFTALNYIGRAQPVAWKQIAQALDNHETELRDAALFAMRETYEMANAEALANFVKDASHCGECRAAAVPALAELHHKRPAWNGNWWATQPVKSPPPAKTVEWEGTPVVLAAVRDALKDSSLEVRLAAIEAVEITKDRESAELLNAMFQKETENDIRKSIVKSLGATKAPEATTLIVSVLRDAAKYSEILPDAVGAAEKLGGREVVQALNNLAGQGSSVPLQKEILLALGTLKSRDSIPVLERFATAADTNLSTTAISSIAKIGGDSAFNALVPLLDATQLTVRRSAIGGLGTMKNKTAVPPLMAAYEKPETRSDALLALANVPDLRALDIYLRGLDDKSGSIRDASRRAIEGIRRQALPEIESVIQTGKPLSSASLTTLQKIYREDEKARQGPIFKNQVDLKSADPATFAAFAASSPGNAAHGKTVFNDLKGLACIKCHKVNGQGGEVGPDLTSVGAKYNRAQIIEAILYPSKLILDGYQQMMVFTKDGDSQAGILRSESAEELTLIDTEGKKHVIPKKQIETRKTSELSLMPDGMQLGLSRQDFSDLVSYVEGLKDKPAAAK